MGQIVALDLLKSSLRLIGAIAVGETPSAAETQDGLRVFNNLLETWSTENLTVLTMQSQTFSFVPGQASYTIGVGGNWNAPRPIQIAYARTTYQGVDFPIEQIYEDWYNLIATKNQQSQIPCWFKYDADYPLGTVTMWPVPNVASRITLVYNEQFPNTVTSATLLDLAPGYERALRFNLAVDLGPEFGIPVQQLVADLARSSKAQIKRANIVPKVARFDEALMGNDYTTIGQFLGGNF